MSILAEGRERFNRNGRHSRGPVSVSLAVQHANPPDRLGVGNFAQVHLVYVGDSQFEHLPYPEPHLACSSMISLFRGFLQR
jgi:hypothetical protein